MWSIEHAQTTLATTPFLVENMKPMLFRKFQFYWILRILVSDWFFSSAFAQLLVCRNLIQCLLGGFGQSFCVYYGVHPVSDAVQGLEEVLLVLECSFWVCLCVCPSSLKAGFLCRNKLNVHPEVLQARLISKVFPLLQMSLKEGKNRGYWGRDTKGKTKRESERDVICLQSIGCTSDHSWDPTIICFHLPASFHFFLSVKFFFSLFFSFNSISIKAGYIGCPLVNCLGALLGDRQTLNRWHDWPYSTLSTVCVRELSVCFYPFGRIKYYCVTCTMHGPNYCNPANYTDQL